MSNAKMSDDWFRNLRLDQLYRTLDRIPVYVYMKDREARYVYGNRKSLDLFGCSAESLCGRRDDEFFPADTVEKLREVDSRVLHGESTFEEIAAGEGDDQRIYMEVKTPIYDRKHPGQVLGLLGISTDITTQKRLEDQIREMAYSDPLTRLPNRRLLFDRIEHAQARCIREGNQSAVLFIDLNGFKQVNDEFGHETGDRLLQEVSSRTLEQVRQTDTLARIGGDEFVLLLEGVGETNFSARRYVDMVIRRIHDALEEPFELDEEHVTVGVTIGSTLFSDNTSPTELVNLADADMYRKKQANAAGTSASA